MDSDDRLEAANDFERIHRAAVSRDPVGGLTHQFYRYPACFPPAFANTVINAFTRPGDTVLDPYMGGGTSVVEALALGRRSVGIDISGLAHFITRVKTTILEADDLERVEGWLEKALENSSLRQPVGRPLAWIRAGYQTNINGHETWAIRKMLEILLSRVSELEKDELEDFARCLLLRTAKWALDCRETIPRVEQFRQKLRESFLQMSRGIGDLRRRTAELRKRGELFWPDLTTLDVESISEHFKSASDSPPRLILTSPPYPGVHVLYHRWQVRGRRETPAPFWIAGCTDSNGAAHYTLGDRKQRKWRDYFERLARSYRGMAEISERGTILVQLLGFSFPRFQLSETLSVLAQAGFTEFTPVVSDAPDGRLWRNVPNRRWYARQKSDLPSSSEVVLFHRFTGDLKSLG